MKDGIAIGAVIFALIAMAAELVVILGAAWLLAGPIVHFAVEHNWIDDSTAENIMYVLRR